MLVIKLASQVSFTQALPFYLRGSVSWPRILWLTGATRDGTINCIEPHPPKNQRHRIGSIQDFYLCVCIIILDC